MKRFAIFTGILSGFLFGVATPFSKLLLNSLNSFQLAGILYLGAAIAMFPFIFRKNNRLSMLFHPGSKIKTLGIILFGGFLGPVLLLFGLRTADAASVSIWLNMELAATAILGVLIFKDTLDRNTWIGVILTIVAGVITSLGEGSGNFIAALFITAACISWAIDNHLTSLTDGASPQSVTFLKGIVAGSVNLTIGCLISSEPLKLGIVGPALLVGIFSYGFSIMLYVTSAQNLGATRGQILFSTAPIWGVILSYTIYRDSFQWVHVISLILLALAVTVIYLLKHKHQHTHIEMEHLHFHQHNDGHHDHDHDDLSIPAGKWHSHVHKHHPLAHEHPHFPDLHHRHEH